MLELKSAFDESCKSLQVLSQFLQRNIFPLLLNCKQRVKTRIENRTALIQINNPLFHVASMKNCDIATSILSSLYNQVRNTQLVIDQFPSSKHTCPLPTSHLINLAKAFSKAHSTHDMFMQLLIESSRPYMNMLAQWITEGAINDPKNEFMICM